jgi:hypothetical protein
MGMSGRTVAAAAVALFCVFCGTARATFPRVADPDRFSYLLNANSLLPLHGVPFGPAPVAMASGGTQADTVRAAGTEAVRFGPRQAVPQLPCQAGDRPEPGLQGRVPPDDLVSGRALQGYSCNLGVVGRYESSSGGTLEAFSHCAYYGLGADVTGTQVVDISDPAHPKPTAVLTSPAMLSPWESLRVNAKRGLLVADHWALLPAPLNAVEEGLNHYLDIYDVSGDCAHPRLLSSTDLAPANGHEGWFSPDGMTYYMSSTGADGEATVHPVDISDTAHPKLLTSWTFPSQTHGGSTTEDGTRSYICQQQAPPKDELWIVDTSDIAKRRPSSQPHLLAGIPLEDNQWCQGAYRVTYHGHPFLIQYGERSGAADCSRSQDNWANFGYPRIFDLADERHPKLVSAALLQVDLPQNCSQVAGEGALNGLGYSVHHCSPDRLYDPTILACDYFGAGMRVTDIRNPYRPVEIGYYNPGTTLVVGTGARPVVLAERHEILFVNDVQGFYIVGFKGSVWPFKGSARCPEYDDYFYAQYNPGSTCPTANFDGIGKPAPGRVLKPRPALRLRVSAAGRRRFRVTARLVPPGSVARGRACRGRATLTVRSGRRVLAREALRVRRTCRIAAIVTIRRRVDRPTFTVRFAGNAALASRSRRAVVRGRHA